MNGNADDLVLLSKDTETIKLNTTTLIKEYLEQRRITLTGFELSALENVKTEKL